MASKIEEFLNKILSNRYGKDVRQAIHDGIKQCYSDVTNPDLNVDAFETAVQNKIDDGSLALLTIPDGSITKEKLDQDTNETIKKNTNDITDLKSAINYKGFSTSRYNALYELLSAIVYDSEKISSEEISDIMDLLFGNDILEGILVKNPSAKQYVASYVYSDEGETSIYSASSGTMRYIFDAVKEDTIYKISTSKTDASSITCYAGSGISDNSENVYSAAVISNNMEKNVTYTGKITVPKGHSLTVVYTSVNFSIKLAVYKEF